MKNWDFKKFSNIYQEFRLGALVTETPHPKTTNLSFLAQNNLQAGVDVLFEVDCDALSCIKNCLDKIIEMAHTIELTIQSGGRIFISGCGATGRLALSIESFWRQIHANKEIVGQVIGLMAGGDVALIRSIENFEDNPEYGVRQLKELGFNEKDLLLAVTEGGETPFVIGTAQYAKRHSRHSPYFLYCNPDDVLIKSAGRSREVIECPLIKKIYFATGPMALSGSTRMQATTVQMLAICLALFEKDIPLALESFLNLHQKNHPRNFLPDFIEEEDRIYKAGEFLQYQTNKMGITVATDTTERSPTFSLTPFETDDINDKKQFSLCYMTQLNAQISLDAWNLVLHRNPRFLEWEDTKVLTGKDRGKKFDLSISGEKRRSKNCQLHLFKMINNNHLLELSLNHLSHKLNFEGVALYQQHLILKTILNIHSTLLMGRQGRYLNNIMTWVRPSNLKLIDRTIRYVTHLQILNGKKPNEYLQIAKALFELLPDFKDEESIVEKIYHRLVG